MRSVLSPKSFLSWGFKVLGYELGSSNNISLFCLYVFKDIFEDAIWSQMVNATSGW